MSENEILIEVDANQYAIQFAQRMVREQGICPCDIEYQQVFRGFYREGRNYFLSCAQ